MVKNSPAKAGRHKSCGFNPWVKRSLGGEHGNPLQYSCLENPMDRGAGRLQSTGSHSQPLLKQLSAHAHTHTYIPILISINFYCFSFFLFLHYHMPSKWHSHLQQTSGYIYFSSFPIYSTLALIFIKPQISTFLQSVQFNCSGLSDSFPPHGLQNTRLPCPSPTHRAFSNSFPFSW